MALFLHGWPETFSYTLTEAVQAGFLPLVPDIGAPAERVKAAGFGVVFDFPVDAVQVLRLLDSLRDDASRVGGDPRSFRLDEAWEKRALRVFRAEGPHDADPPQLPVSSRTPGQRVRLKGPNGPKSAERARQAPERRQGAVRPKPSRKAVPAQ
jgi:hypothetical protein